MQTWHGKQSMAKHGTWPSSVCCIKPVHTRSLKNWMISWSDLKLQYVYSHWYYSHTKQKQLKLSREKFGPCETRDKSCKSKIRRSISCHEYWGLKTPKLPWNENVCLTVNHEHKVNSKASVVRTSILWLPHPSYKIISSLFCQFPTVSEKKTNWVSLWDYIIHQHQDCKTNPVMHEFTAWFTSTELWKKEITTNLIWRMQFSL